MSVRGGGVEMTGVRQALDVAHGGVAFQFGDMANPQAVIAGFDVRRELFENLASIADKGGVNFHVLVNLGAVDLDMDLAGAFRVRAEVAGDAIIEAHAHGDEEVGFLNGIIDPGFAVHAHHAEVQRIAGWEAADAEEGHGDGIIAGANKLLKGAHGAGEHDAAAGKNHRPLGGIQEFQSAVKFRLVVIAAAALWRKLRR